MSLADSIRTDNEAGSAAVDGLNINRNTGVGLEAGI